MIVAAFALFVASLSVLLGPVVWALLGSVAYLQLGESAWVPVLRTLAAVLVASGALLMLHYYLPNSRQRLRDILPGITVTVALWALGALLFGFYLGTLADYSLTYGSLGGVMITLVFFYLLGLIFLYGAELNAAWIRYRQGRSQEEPVADSAPER